MDHSLPPFLLQFLGSLAAILAIVWLVRRMGLGGQPRLDSEEAVRLAAGEVADGFAPVAVAMDRQGRSALARDQDDQIVVLRPHGSRIAGRVLAPGAKAISDGTDLEIDTGERLFGTVVLQLDDPEPWAIAINRLSGSGDA